MDGAAWIVLAADHLKASQKAQVALTLQMPEAVSWYPSPADIPDEPESERWYVWTATVLEEGSLISLEDWLDYPAGARGRIVRREDKRHYGDPPIKLWGINLCYSACAPEKNLAEKRARLYSRYSINAVRLRMFANGPGWAGIRAPESCLEFDSQALDRMDYQVAKLKEVGIFVALSAHFGTPSLGPKDRQYVLYLDEFGSFSTNAERVRGSSVPACSKWSIVPSCSPSGSTYSPTRWAWKDRPSWAPTVLVCKAGMFPSCSRTGTTAASVRDWDASNGTSRRRMCSASSLRWPAKCCVAT